MKLLFHSLTLMFSKGSVGLPALPILIKRFESLSCATISYRLSAKHPLFVIISRMVCGVSICLIVICLRHGLRPSFRESQPGMSFLFLVFKSEFFATILHTLQLTS